MAFDRMRIFNVAQKNTGAKRPSSMVPGNRAQWHIKSWRITTQNWNSLATKHVDHRTPQCLAVRCSTRVMHNAVVCRSATPGSLRVLTHCRFEYGFPEMFNKFASFDKQMGNC
jgi:hypothetical protein